DPAAKVRVQIGVVPAREELAGGRITVSYGCNQFFVSHVLTLSPEGIDAASPATGNLMREYVPVTIGKICRLGPAHSFQFARQRVAAEAKPARSVALITGACLNHRPNVGALDLGEADVGIT